MRGGTAVLLSGVVVAAASGGCSSNDLTDPTASTPRVVSATAASNPNNVLSTAVAFTAAQADSARVMYLGDDGSLDSTPYVDVTGGVDTIVTLGLRPSTPYRNVLEIMGPGGSDRSDTLSFTTSPLPELLQRVLVSTSGVGGGGLTLTPVQVGGNAVFALAFDSGGTIRWYRRFEGTERVGGELKQQSNGHFTMYRGSSTGVEPVSGHFVEFTPVGDSVRAITVDPPRYPDSHDLLITTGPDGGERFHLFTYDHRVRDLTPIGGGAAESLAGHQLVRLRPDGSPEFEWNAWDSLRVDEWIEPPRPDPADATERDFDHPNSLAFDRDGNYIVSWRNLGQVMKIDAVSKAVIWRLGGRRSDFTILGDPLGGFSAQHSANVLPNGNVLLYDNGTRHQPPESRAVEYALDLVGRTATLVWEFRHSPPIYTTSVGLVQRLQNGNTLVGYGLVGHATEVGPDASVRWEADVRVDGVPAFVYRLVRIASLYRYSPP